MFSPMLTNVLALSIAHTWLCAIKTRMACSIKKQTALFLKSFPLCVEAPVRCGQHGGQKATAVRDIVNWNIDKCFCFFDGMFKILRIHFSAQPQCPGDLHYMEMGPAFPPTCTNPQPYPELSSTCQPPQGWSFPKTNKVREILSDFCIIFSYSQGRSWMTAFLPTIPLMWRTVHVCMGRKYMHQGGTVQPSARHGKKYIIPCGLKVLKSQTGSW